MLARSCESGADPQALCAAHLPADDPGAGDPGAGDPGTFCPLDPTCFHATDEDRGMNLAETRW